MSHWKKGKRGRADDCDLSGFSPRPSRRSHDEARAPVRARSRQLSIRCSHSVATHLVRAGADVRHVQMILGHENIETTEIYTHVAVLDVARAFSKSHPRAKPDARAGAPARLGKLTYRRHKP